MASGVGRPTTLVDILGTLNQQSQQQTGTDAFDGLGDFAETDEQATVADSATVTHQVTPTWDAGTWGTVLWA